MQSRRLAEDIFKHHVESGNQPRAEWVQRMAKHGALTAFQEFIENKNAAAGLEHSRALVQTAHCVRDDREDEVEDNVIERLILERQPHGIGLNEA